MPTTQMLTLTTDRSATASRAAAAAVAARRPIRRLTEARSRAKRQFADDLLRAAAATWDDPARPAPPGRASHAVAHAARELAPVAA